MKKIVTLIFIFIGIVFVSGCSDRGEPESAILSTSTITITATSLPTRTIIPQPTATATTDPCFQQVDIETMSTNLSGYLVLKDKSYDTEEYYLDWENREHIPFQTQRAHPYQMSLSPNGQWLAYYADVDILVVEELFGKFQYTLNMDSISPEWNTLFGWIDNETLFVKFYGADQNEMDYLMAINPFSGRVQKLISSDYPGITEYWWDWRRNTFWSSLVFFDTDMRYVVYPADADEDANYRHLVLYDTQEENIIGKTGKTGGSLVEPIWKKDSSGYYYVLSEYDYDANKFKSEWYFMDISGEVTKLTSYLQQYEYASIFSDALSPDEKHLFYGVHLSDDQEIMQSSIQILDLETLEIINTCQPIGNFDSVVWSPDSRFISYSEELEEESYRTLIMDVESRTISIAEESVYPILWVRAIDQ